MRKGKTQAYEMPEDDDDDDFEEIVDINEFEEEIEERPVSKKSSSKGSKKNKSRSKKTSSAPQFPKLGGLAAKQKKMKDAKDEKKRRAKERAEAKENARTQKAGKGDAPISPATFYAIIGGSVGFLVLALALAGGVFFWLSQSSKIEAPTEFTTVVEKNSKLMCEYPADWTVEKLGGGRGGIPPFIVIEKGNFRAQIRGSNAGAALGDIARAGAGGADDDIDLAPVRSIHDSKKSIFIKKNDFQDYSETEPERIRTGLGDSRLSAFSSKYYFGYRATLLTSVHQYDVMCRCRYKKEWEIYEPIFRKLIVSISMKEGR